MNIAMKQALLEFLHTTERLEKLLVYLNEPADRREAISNRELLSELHLIQHHDLDSDARLLAYIRFLMEHGLLHEQVTDPLLFSDYLLLNGSPG